MPPRLNAAALGRLGVDEALIAGRERLDGRHALELLAELLDMVALWQRRLGLRGARIFPGGVLSAVLCCTREAAGAPVVLKLSAANAANAANAASTRAEAAALRAWGGVGACELLYATEDGTVMLLEAIEPGTAVVAGTDDGVDARRGAELLGQLHRIRAERIPGAVREAGHELRWRFERAYAQLERSSHARGEISHERVEDAYGRRSRSTTPRRAG